MKKRVRRRRRKPPVGARPGTLAIDPQGSAPRLQVIVYGPGRYEEHRPARPAEIRNLMRGDTRLWVDVQGLGDEGILRELAEIFSIHHLALEDVVHYPTRPKTEEYAHNLLTVVRMLQSTELPEVATEQVSVFLGPRYVLTFQQEHGDVLDPVRRRMQEESSTTRRAGSDYLAYAILDTIIDAYYPVIESLGDRIDRLEEQVLTRATPETLRELTRIKSGLLELRRAVVPQREAINALTRTESELVDDNVRLHLRDTYDHVIQTADAVESARELVNGLLNVYLSVVSNRMNEIMKTLTIMATIFIPLTFMAGIYGMNFQYMPELGVRWAYPALLGAMAVVIVAMVVYFWRRGWISRE